MTFFVSCDVDTTVSIRCAVASDSELGKKLRRHVIELEDGRRYDTYMSLL